jgi:hypothetical protein
MNHSQFAAGVNADIRRMVAPAEPSQLERDAEAYRFLRDPPASKPDLEAAVLWEELLTSGCRGAEWDKTVAALRELYADRGWI